MSDLIKPKWELYDLSNNPEHDLFKSYIVEYTDIGGILIEYYIRDETIEMDTLYGESVNTRYFDSMSTKILYEPTEEPTITSGFGINSEESISYASMPKFTFSRDVSANYIPKPGDVIRTIWNNRTYEIVDVYEEEQIFQLKKMAWGFVLKTFRFSEQSISSKNISNEIDSTLTNSISAFGDNKWIEEESNINIDYDSDIYGF